MAVWDRQSVIQKPSCAWALPGLPALRGSPGATTAGTLQGASTTVASKVPKGFGAPRRRQDGPEEDKAVTPERRRRDLNPCPQMEVRAASGPGVAARISH